MPKRAKQRGKGFLANAAKTIKAIKGIRSAGGVLGARTLASAIPAAIGTYDAANHGAELVNGREEQPRTWVDTAKEYITPAFAMYKTANEYTKPSRWIKAADLLFLSDGIGPQQKNDLRHAMGAAADIASLAGYGRRKRKATRKRK